MAATEELRIAAIPTDVEIDPVTLDIIEGALKSARYEMDAVLFRSAMSPVIREQHDEFPMLTDPRGRMVVGQFGAYINEMMEDWTRGIYPGDVILCADPFKCSGSISHTNDWLVLVPIFFEDELVGWASQFGHMMDAGGPLPGALPTGAKTIFGEGIIIPPIKVVERGVVQEDVLGLILNNVRIPEMNRADLFAIIAGCRAGEARVMELCTRFGKPTYLAALQALLDRTHEAMRKLILMAIPETPQTFEDWVDDDGLGNGPFKMRLTIWREGEHAYFDWSGTDPQALGPVNFYLSEGMFKMFIGIYLIMVNDPQILFNDGFYPLLHVVMPEGSLLRPRFPAALGCRTHALARLFDVLGGALCKNAPDLNTAAGYGTSPYMLYSGWKESVDGAQPGEFFYSMEILYGGIPGRPIGDGMDGHSWWPLFENIPTEYLEAYYPMRIDGYTTIPDTGGAGLHRGGNGVEKRYVYLEPGEVSIHDDRWLTRPWGVLGGLPGARSNKLLVRADGSEQVLPSKCDEVEVQPGDMLVYRTAGGGGWKDRFDRPAGTVARDVSFGLVTVAGAKANYGVVLAADGGVDTAATDAERTRQRSERGDAQAFDFGPSLEETLANCLAETGLEPPKPATPLRWSPLEPGDAALKRVRDADAAAAAAGD
ncbi:MAG TPA: hydantoinase B/oxoprolinase family protein [Gaiellales bacterium]